MIRMFVEVPLESWNAFLGTIGLIHQSLTFVIVVFLVLGFVAEGKYSKNINSYQLAEGLEEKKKALLNLFDWLSVRSLSTAILFLSWLIIFISVLLQASYLGIIDVVLFVGMSLFFAKKISNLQLKNV